MKFLWALLLFGFSNQYRASEGSATTSPLSLTSANSTASLGTVANKSLSNVSSQITPSPVPTTAEKNSTSASSIVTAATIASGSIATQSDQVKSMTESRLTTEAARAAGGSPATTAISVATTNVSASLQQVTTSRTPPGIVSTVHQVDRRNSTHQPPVSISQPTSAVLSWTAASTANSRPNVTAANDSLPRTQPTAAKKQEELHCLHLERSSEADDKIICTTEEKIKIILKVRRELWERLQKDFQGSKGIPDITPSSIPSPSSWPSPSHSPSPSPPNTYLVSILASSSALLAIIIGIIAWTVCHRRCRTKNQQHLTEELHTTENGYHDNPTLEVMEVQPEMQEKKMVLNGEFNDSWIVPFDNLVKDDLPDEEDTHL